MALDKRHSQEKEDDHILLHFGQRLGTFLDIGAYDGQTISNTYVLSKRGWGGVCIEPDPVAFGNLALAHQAHPQVQLVRACIGAHDGWTNYYNNGYGLSSMLPDWRPFPNMEPGPVSRVPVMTVRTLLNQWSFLYSRYEFVNIDVEGMDIVILHQLPLEELHTEVVCIEVRNADRNAVVKYLRERGFLPAYWNSANMLFVKMPRTA